MTQSNLVEAEKHRLVALILAVAFIVQCIGEGITITYFGSAFARTLWLDFGLSDHLAFMIDRLCYYGVMLLVVWAFYAKKAIPFFLAGFWFLFLSLHEFHQGGSPGAPYSIPAHAVRYATPCVLAFLLYSKNNVPPKLSYYILTASAACVFATHGLEALNHNPRFIDYIIRVCRNYAFLMVSEEQARQLLYLIGVQDIILAGLVLLRPRKIVFAYMAFWGFMTAFVRILYSPRYGIPLTLVRATNGGVPLALLYMKRKG